MGERSKRRALWFLPLGSDPTTAKEILLTAHRVLLYVGYKVKKVNGCFLTYRRGTRRKVELPFRHGVPDEVKLHLNKVKPKGWSNE